MYTTIINLAIRLLCRLLPYANTEGFSKDDIKRISKENGYTVIVFPARVIKIPHETGTIVRFD